MNSISSVFTQAHRAIDDEFAIAEKAVADLDWKKASDAFRRYKNILEGHLNHEESILFPEIEARTEMTAGPTRVMRMEHEDMRRLLEGMEQDIANQDSEHYLGLSETLLILIQQHNMKEENILYPMADNVLGNEQDAILKRVKAMDEGQGKVA